MPSRRSHANSHHGCAQCKARRVKCDESYPVCRKCTTRGIRCSNEDLSISSTFQRCSTSPTKSSCFTEDVLESESFTGLHQPILLPGLPCYGSLVNSSPSPLPLMQLMHHYTLHTAKTFCDYPFFLPLWQSVVPSLALGNPFLLHSIAALSSMHLAHLSPPSESHIYLQVALDHQDAAFALIRPSINDINAQNASALLVASFFVPIFDFASRTPSASSLVSTSILTSRPGTDISSHFFSNQTRFPLLEAPYDKSISQQPPTTLIIPHHDVLSQLQTILNLCRGILTILDITSPFVRTGPLASLLYQHFSDEAPAAAPDVEAAIDRLDAFSDSFSLSCYTVLEVSTPPCKRVIALLRRAFRTAHAAPGCFSATFKWAVIVDDAFLAAVRREEEPALCVLGLYGVLFHGLDGCWWTRGWGRAFVRAVGERVQSREGKDLMAWARDRVGDGEV